jgi:hypothetical protein
MMLFLREIIKQFKVASLSTLEGPTPRETITGLLVFIVLPVHKTENFLWYNQGTINFVVT